MKVRFICIVLALVLTGCAFDDPPGSPAGGSFVPEPAQTTVSPDPGYHFAAIGDWGTGWTTEYTLARRMCELHEEAPFDYVVTAGDNIYETGAPRDFDEKFYQPMRCLRRRGVQFRAVLGNHDILTRNGRPELHEPRFGMNGRNYVFREGGVRFVMVDSNRMRKRWLRQALVTEDGDLWTVVVFHHPVYSSSSGHESTGDFRYTLPDIFEKRGVDLVINGHTHVYAVTEPLHRIRYVTTGGGSASPHPCARRWYTERCVVAYHFLSIVAGPDEIKVVAIGRDGAPIDRFSTTGRD